MEEGKSQFGKGLVICLVKFAEHFMQPQYDKEMYKKIRTDEETTVELWANGATDHLYEIEVPEGKEWDEIREKVKDLRSFGLDMGHGFKNSYTVKDADDLMAKTRDIALLIDKKLGLKPDIGYW